MDDMCHSYNLVVAGIGQRLHDGWSRPHPPGHRHRGGAGPSYSGPKTLVAFLTLAGEGEVLRKEVISRSKRFYRITMSFVESVLQPPISPPINKKG